MSEPRIFECRGSGFIIPLTVTMEGCRDERVLRDDWFVRWQEYDRLEAENARLKAEVERLRKAGDGLIIAYQWLTVEQPDIVRSIKAAFKEWNAAKEAKPDA